VAIRGKPQTGSSATETALLCLAVSSGERNDL
jgi:hypothetical protein